MKEQPDKYVSITESLPSVPNYLSSAGMMAIVVLLMLGVAVSALVSFPETIVCKVELVTRTPTVRLVSQSDGYVSDLRAHNGDTIRAGEIVAVIASDADYDAIQNLETRLREFCETDGVSRAWLNDLCAPRTGLGAVVGDAFRQLQTESEVVLECLRDTRQAWHRESVLIAQRRVETLRAFDSLLQDQIELQSRKYERVVELAENGLASDEEVEDAERGVLLVRNEKQDNRVDLLEAEQAYCNQRHQFDVFRYETCDSARILRTIWTRVEQVRSAIRGWKERYVLSTPSPGIVSLTEIWQDRGFVTAGQHVATVVPVRREFTARTVIGESRTGLMKTGSAIRIVWDGYPEAQFGRCDARVDEVSTAYEDGSLGVTIELPREVLTEKGERISLKPGMKGDGEILLDNRSLLLRFVDRLLGRA